MQIERILIRMMMGLGVIFILLDLTYYAGRSVLFISVMMVVLFIGDMLLKNPQKGKEEKQAKSSMIEKIIIGMIMLTVIAVSVCLAMLWKLGPFGRL